MGFLELHLHEPNFTLNTSEKESSGMSGMFGRKKHKHGHEHGHGKHKKHGKHEKHEEHDEESTSVGKKLAPVLALFAIAVVVRRMKRRAR